MKGLTGFGFVDAKGCEMMWTGTTMRLVGCYCDCGWISLIVEERFKMVDCFERLTEEVVSFHFLPGLFHLVGIIVFVHCTDIKVNVNCQV